MSSSRYPDNQCGAPTTPHHASEPTTTQPAESGYTSVAPHLPVAVSDEIVAHANLNYDTGYTHKLPDPNQRKKNGRVEGRNLIPWTRPRMVDKLMLHLVYECARHRIELPWDAVAHRFNPGSSGAAVMQYLSRLRGSLIAEGHLVPPAVSQKPNARTREHPDVRGYIRADFISHDVQTLRQVYFKDPCPDRRFCAPDGFDNVSAHKKSRSKKKKNQTAPAEDVRPSVNPMHTAWNEDPLTQGGYEVHEGEDDTAAFASTNDGDDELDDAEASDNETPDTAENESSAVAHAVANGFQPPAGSQNQIVPQAPASQKNDAQNIVEEYRFFTGARAPQHIARFPVDVTEGQTVNGSRDELDAFTDALIQQQSALEAPSSEEPPVNTPRSEYHILAGTPAARSQAAPTAVAGAGNQLNLNLSQDELNAVMGISRIQSKAATSIRTANQSAMVFDNAADEFAALTGTHVANQYSPDGTNQAVDNPVGAQGKVTPPKFTAVTHKTQSPLARTYSAATPSVPRNMTVEETRAYLASIIEATATGKAKAQQINAPNYETTIQRPYAQGSRPRRSQVPTVRHSQLPRQQHQGANHHQQAVSLQQHTVNQQHQALGQQHQVTSQQFNLEQYHQWLNDQHDTSDQHSGNANDADKDSASQDESEVVTPSIESNNEVLNGTEQAPTGANTEFDFSEFNLAEQAADLVANQPHMHWAQFGALAGLVPGFVNYQAQAPKRMFDEAEPTPAPSSSQRPAKRARQMLAEDEGEE